MGKFQYEAIRHLINASYKIAVETGTCFGESANTLSLYFDSVYTIEIKKELYEMTKNKLKDNTKINCIFGDSKVKILELADTLNNSDSNIVFWLDAHWSGDNTVNWDESWWKGYNLNTGYSDDPENTSGIPTAKQQVPLDDEIMNIYNNIHKECIIYIDDFDKIDKHTLKGLKNKAFKEENWTHLDFNVIFDKIKDRTLDIIISHEQCIIKLKAR